MQLQKMYTTKKLISMRNKTEFKMQIPIIYFSNDIE